MVKDSWQNTYPLMISGAEKAEIFIPSEPKMTVWWHFSISKVRRNQCGMHTMYHCPFQVYESVQNYTICLERRPGSCSLRCHDWMIRKTVRRIDIEKCTYLHNFQIWGRSRPGYPHVAAHLHARSTTLESRAYQSLSWAEQIYGRPDSWIWQQPWAKSWETDSLTDVDKKFVHPDIRNKIRWNSYIDKWNSNHAS